MGGYLLKGYRMLGDCCDVCGTILLQDKQQKLYCVSCQELDSDVDKDNPVLNAQAALSQTRALRGGCRGRESPPPSACCPFSYNSCPRSGPGTPSSPPSYRVQASLETSIQLCSLIASCANSLRSLKELSQ
ncbi:hypothetical protein KUCAC02_003429 [Chaenocephalus aceratus]|uniref:Uncharacterized protein n=1 Tax=Chaenocephalus aceratus TaxID=36190 RepID=A0ACB9WM88_CHAAC|nr:hypothetical protein KUCAC02_003429 [Chaenocephalus aceratus]